MVRRTRRHTPVVTGEGCEKDLLERWLQEGMTTLDRITVSASDVVAVMDPDCIVRYVNWTAPGLTRQGVVGQSAFTMIPPGDKDAAREAFDTALHDGRSSRFEITYTNEVGVLVFVVRVNPIFHEDKVIGAFTINTDVTEERRETMDRDRFFSLSLDMLIVVTQQGKIRRLNPAFSQTLGYASVSDVAGRPFLDFVHPDDVEATLESFKSVQGGNLVNVFENRYQRQDGTYRVFSWRGTVDPLTCDVYAVARDVTEHRATETQLRHAQKMEAVGQLAGGIAHDFNNLMQAVLANVEVALATESASTSLMEHLHEIEAAGERAAELTKQLLLFSRRQPLDRETIDLNVLIQGLMKLLRRLLPENITIRASLRQGLAAVNADRTQLEQVVINLGVNARDAMESGGILSVETSNATIDEAECEAHPWAKPGSFACLRVTDTGAGMSPEVRERAFDPFFTTKSHRSGTGLGLATLYGIVRQHGGLVQLHSEEGKGTTVEVFLPAHDSHSQSRPAPDNHPRPGRGSETILVAEDEEVVRRPMLKILEGAGYRTLAASNGREAIELLSANLDAVDLVLLDVVMPELGGPEAWQHMRKMRPDLEVIFTSGYADDYYRERLPPDVDVLDKPFRGEELLRRIRHLLDTYSALR